MTTLYITGAGVSAESGIPTFRGEDGFWTIGSRNYTPQEMATRAMYENDPLQFLRWYYQRFASYRHHGPNAVHRWLADKNLITQNIDGLDGKAGNKDYIAIHGRLDQMTIFHDQNLADQVTALYTPWDEVEENRLDDSLRSVFRIRDRPRIGESYKPFVLLFDEYYTELYRISEARSRMIGAERMVFMGTSFSVNITMMALEIAMANETPIEIVDPEPVTVPYENTTYHAMTALRYIEEIAA
ncbi:SIR2 family NAD-dependent protein deacylase [Congregibacter litoralis]|uniref:protein acetyllysine N-acetyltransferase n=1 Tax=Congregibacter litoralis KT71 TaxID=314285 RepID=A4A980_9GAMM|nr:Sir2 family NAD-dependent protein deacetylase [Congregibacter litoralis]EAQ97622.1 NAD-dependent protein deacetylase, SIR2 family [Congregibacter litoralis KT71]